MPTVRQAGESRKLERRYRRTGADADRLAWVKQLRATHALYKDKEKHHRREKIAEKKGNSKKLWLTMSGIMGEKPGGRCDDSDCTADDFAKFFSDNVDSVRSATSATPQKDSADTASHVINGWKLSLIHI